MRSMGSAPLASRFAPNARVTYDRVVNWAVINALAVSLKTFAIIAKESI